MLPVVSAKHALAKERGRIAIKRLAEFTQIVLSERSDPGVLDEAVLSPRTWRIADLHTKHMMLRAGLGWGNLPEHVIHDDLQQGRMVLIAPAPWGENEHTLYLSAIYQLDATLGPAHRWILEQLPVLCSKSAPGTEPRQGKRRKRR
jgi:DNA-binding transcriptional LysR family regulator